MSAELQAAIREFKERPAKPGSPWYGAGQLEPERVIRCSPQNADAAIARAIAKAVVLAELWRVELEGGDF